jgi:hypothetical protein
VSAREIRLFAFTCNYCGVSQQGPVLPYGWRICIRKTHGCGLTGYTATETLHACQSCAPAAKDSEAWA